MKKIAFLALALIFIACNSAQSPESYEGDDGLSLPSTDDVVSGGGGNPGGTLVGSNGDNRGDLDNFGCFLSKQRDTNFFCSRLIYEAADDLSFSQYVSNLRGADSFLASSGSSHQLFEVTDFLHLEFFLGPQTTDGCYNKKGLILASPSTEPFMAAQFDLEVYVSGQLLHTETVGPLPVGEASISVDLSTKVHQFTGGSLSQMNFIIKNFSTDYRCNNTIITRTLNNQTATSDNSLEDHQNVSTTSTTGGDTGGSGVNPYCIARWPISQNICGQIDVKIHNNNTPHD